MSYFSHYAVSVFKPPEEPISLRNNEAWFIWTKSENETQRALDEIVLKVNGDHFKSSVITEMV